MADTLSDNEFADLVPKSQRYMGSDTESDTDAEGDMLTPDSRVNEGSFQEALLMQCVSNIMGKASVLYLKPVSRAEMLNDTDQCPHDTSAKSTGCQVASVGLSSGCHRRCSALQ